MPTGLTLYRRMEDLRADQDAPNPHFLFRGAGFVLGAKVTAMRIPFRQK